MKKLCAAAMLLLSFAGLYAQNTQPMPQAILDRDSETLAGLQHLTLPASYATRPLPYKKDNTRLIYFSGIYSQEVWNCNQAASIWTLFTYEINYLRNLNSSSTDNQYSPMAVYNLLNHGNSIQGVSYFDSWNLVKANGIPGNPDFTAYSQNSTLWMTGYDKYYRGMKNRVDEVYAIDVSNPDGLLTLKHWINDHLDGSQVGGLANFQIGSDDMYIPQIPLDQNLEEEGQYIVVKYGPWVGHAMTFAGWNDSVRYDVNGDGRYTNNEDINGDGVVDMKDWEIGAMLVVNSWSTWWGNAGKVWVMYRVLAEKVEKGGIWNNAAMVMRPKKTYNPLMTIKATVRYNQRNRLKIMAGVSANPNATVPDRLIDFPCFNFQGDTLPMRGYYDSNSEELEFGLDITPLMNYLSAYGTGRIFLDVVQKAPDSKGTGSVASFSVMDYSGLQAEYTCPNANVTIQTNGLTRLSVPVQAKVARPQILNESLPDAEVGKEYRVQLEADGSTGPYRYENPALLFVEKPDATLSLNGGSEVLSAGQTSKVMDLPFNFPFYGGNYNQVTVLSDGGLIMGPSVVIYPYVIDNRLRFYQNKGVFPFLTNLYYPGSNQQVTFESSASEVIVRWHANADPEGSHPVEFAARLKPDGTVVFSYGTMGITPDMSWISGLSAGDNRNFHVMEYDYTGMTSNSAYGLSLLAWPAWLSLSGNGDLHGTPDKPGTHTLPLKVTDGSGISSYQEMTLTVTGSSGMENLPVQGRVSIFPNPSQGSVWLYGESKTAGKARFSVYNIDGKRLIYKDLNLNAGKVELEISDAKTLQPGIYVYRVEGSMEATGKIIRR